MLAGFFVRKTAGPKQPVSQEKPATVFEYWNSDSPSLSALVSYVEDVTNESSENFITQEDRIAVFEMDGTLMGNYVRRILA